MSYGIIYIATNRSKPHMKYVGQTTNTLERRKRAGYNSYFLRALKKYEFDWEIKAIATNQEELDYLECFYIKFYNAICPNGYCFQKGGKKNKIVSAITRKKISDTLKKKYNNPENHPCYGRILSEEHKKKISMNSGMKRPEIAKKLSEITKGRIHTPEALAKMAETRSLYWLIIKPDGHKEIIKNLAKYCRENKLNCQSMIRVAQGQRNHHKNYKCQKLED